MLKRLALALLVLSLTSGCAINRATATVTPDADLGSAKAFFVVQLREDSRGIGKLVSDNLVKRGFRASAGAEVPRPPKVDAVVTYVDRWMWDMTMYMVELTLTIRNPESNFPMASGNSYHTSLSRKSPEEMVDEVLTNIFNAKK
jgi:hypothetical protein